MTDSDKLLMLADWFDNEQKSGRWTDTINPNEVQDDLRRMAASLASKEACRKLALKIARERNALANALRWCRLLLRNLVKEQTGWRRVFGRWTISDEPLRADAAAVLKVVDAAMVERDEVEAQSAELQKYTEALTPEDRAALDALPSVIDRMSEWS